MTMMSGDRYLARRSRREGGKKKSVGGFVSESSEIKKKKSLQEKKREMDRERWAKDAEKALTAEGGSSLEAPRHRQPQLQGQPNTSELTGPTGNQPWSQWVANRE